MELYNFLNADHAFRAMYKYIDTFGEVDPTGNKAVYNHGFHLQKPLDRTIKASFRKWSANYAEREWQWYQSRDRSVADIKKFAPIWDNMHSGDDIVNSNYGWQINRNDQLEKCIFQLRRDDATRQAFVSIYDGKEKDDYEFDTPCTMSIGFMVHRGKLCMSVNMRSNDLWYGFCNDQYCFSKIQEYVARRLQIPIGWYYHHATNLHLYPDRFGLSD